MRLSTMASLTWLGTGSPPRAALLIAPFSLVSEHTSLDVDYPMRSHSMGTEAAFLEWYPVLVPNPGSETSTRFFWSILFNWFTVGVLLFVTSIDLDERKKYTPFVYGDSINSLTCGGAVKTSGRFFDRNASHSLTLMCSV